jgi:glycine cleavage system H lipoate-binding protein
MDQIGMISLIPVERASKADLLPITLPRTSVSKALDPVQLIITLALGLIILSIAVTYAIRFRRLNRPSIAARSAASAGAMSESGLNIPKGVYFDKSHTWAFMETDGTVKVGVDDFLQHVTGKLTRIQMKKPGEKVIKGEAMVTFIQNGKQLIVSSPLSGVIKAENKLLFTDPSLLNQSPFNDGWVYQIEPTNWSRENQFLFMADKYTDWVKGEFRRLRDFLAMAIKPESPEFAYVTLQDGGEITDNVLSNMGPEVWEEFQTRFMDATK